MNWRVFATMLTGVLLAACANEPSITGSEDWHQRGDSEIVSVCYSERSSTRAQVVDLAASQCPPSTPNLQLIEDSPLFNDCPLTKRHRATFQCVGQ